MNHIQRIRRLAGLQEARQVVDPDEQDRRDDERSAREAKIGRLISIAFQRIGLSIAEDGILYDDADREANVTLDDSQIDLEILAKLQQTGLAHRYTIWAATNDMIIIFSVIPELDHAVA